MRSKYGESQWHDLIKPIADKLRERQRNALADYLVARDGLTGADDLYERYLIDVQTGSCLKTTRLLQATAAAQLFVQRVILNLEKDLSLTPDKRKLWDWMHSYRVWEANRKVFLFPENWLLPELRDDKTATFRQMESALTEQESSPEIARSALLGYLEELGDLAQISVIAMYQDQNTLYVVGRAPDQPYRYFWRSCAQFGGDEMSWTGWEALDLDNANDFIMPFVFGGDLHVAWPIFRETRNDTRLMWEVQIAWTRRSNQGWVRRKLGKAQLINVERLENKDASTSFAFRFGKQVLPVLGSEILKRERINIDCYAATEITPHTSLAPDPSLLLDTTPVGYLSVPDSQWNVNCEVKGVVYKYVTSDKEGDKFYKGWDGVRVDLKALRHDRDGTSANITQLAPNRTTGTDGKFSFLFRTNIFGKNGFEGVINGARIELTFNLPGHAPIVKTGSLVRSSAQGTEYYFHWTWEINVGAEDKELANLFVADRAVNYQTVGAFIFETGKDIRHDPSPGPMPLPGTVPNLIVLPFYSPVNMSVDGNRFLAKKTATATSIASIAFGAEGTLSPSPTISFPVFVTRATQGQAPGSPPEPHVWYLQDNDGSSYLRKREGIWYRWADGQLFASSYRTAATLSTSLLFSTEVQTDLVDSFADNFLRLAPYANYNWELFLHIPLAIADHLASQQRFADARLWLHAVFDPTTDKKIKDVPQYWRFLPFHNDAQPDSIAQMLTWLADPTMVDPKDAKDIEEKLKPQIEEWRKNPFMPHLIARLRPSAYQWHTFFAYLDVLIGWGDQLFRRDTRESVNEATLLYVLAAKLLGPRPRTIPAPTPPPPQTYRSLQANKLDEFSNAWVRYLDLPGTKRLISRTTQRASSTQGQVTAGGGSAAVMVARGREITFGGTGGITGVSTGIAVKQPSGVEPQLITSLSALAFCIPQNEKVTEFYDRIENRLFNVRNCRNIEGVFRDLPLYEPPIDPLLLIRARAAGLDIYDVIAGLYAPLPNYRFSFTLQKALELCAELKALGGALLSALEKKDAEELTLLRSSHEIAMLKLVSDTRKQQIAEAEANIAALQQSEVTILERFGQYQKLLGKPGITKGQDGLPVVEQSSSLAVSTDAGGGVSGLGLSRKEVDQTILTAVAHVHTQAANSGHILAGVLSLFPNIWAGGVFAGQTFGGVNLGSAASAIAKSIEMGAAEANYLANQMGAFGSYERRQDEWVHQSKLALDEVNQIQKQILAAQIRKDIAERELSNHETQIDNAQQVDEFMRGKFTSQQLYRWMSSEIAEAYFRTYQLTLDQARRAERGYQHELGLDNKTTPFVQAGQWDSLKRGLLAGEHLHHDLKRMESAYLERNVRELEITKHISLLQLDPGALIALKETCTCDFDVPEVVFDLDYPGHYMRRLKMVSLSIPCVAGPYASVSATLKLIKNEIRAKPTGSYERLPEPDTRFMKTAATITAVVTSSAQQDSGMFEPNLRDERYLPFEGAGVISTWHIELPSEFRAFDYDSIADVILHVRYTARNSDDLKDKASQKLLSAINSILAAGKTGMARLFSLRQEFPTEWRQLMGGTNPSPTGNQSQVFAITKDRFPFLFVGKQIKISSVDLYALPKSDAQSPVFPAMTVTPPKGIATTLIGATDVGRLLGKTLPLVAEVRVEEPATWKLEIPNADVAEFQKDIDDILMVCHYKLAGQTIADRP